MLTLSNISKVFNKGTINERVALEGVSLYMEAGEFVTVIGGNGAGKSTLLNIIAGVYQPDSGELELDGMRINQVPEYKRARYIGRVFQDPLRGTAGSLSIEENLILALYRGMRKSLRRAITGRERSLFKEHLSYIGLGLENRLTDKVQLLSGGQRQALTLLMAILQRPKLLLLDEHIAALDPKTARIILDLTCDLVQNEKLTTLMVTHNMEDALRVGNRTIMMHEGRIILDIKGEERNKLTKQHLLELFEKVSGKSLDSDRLLLS